jgi:alcohol dehydrogenase YqhD (iron-dependent ADH family)
VAHGAANPETDVWDFWAGKAKVCRSLPVGAVLTIAAAGSETSDSSVLTNDEAKPFTKRGITTQFNRCAFAVMNPELTMTLPAYQIGAGAADIFMHTSERYFTPLTGNFLTDEIAEGLFRDIIRFGPAGVKNPHDYDAMSEIMWCGSVSHVGLTGLGARGNTSRDGDWACHQLGMTISALRNSTHGATLTAVWGAWARFVCGENPARFAQLGRRVFGVTAPDDGAAAAQTIEKSEAFFRSLGMPVSLTELFGSAPGESELAAFAENCSYGRSRTIGSFKVLGYDDILAIYRAAV